MLIRNDKPAYRILTVEGFFGPNDHLYPEGEMIYFDGIPNEDMEPLNDLAREKMRAYLEALDAEAKRVAEKAGRAFVARPRTLDQAIAQASADARQVQLVQGGPGVPLMGARKDPGAVERIEPDPVPEQGHVRANQPPRPKARISNDLTTR